MSPKLMRRPRAKLVSAIGLVAGVIALVAGGPTAAAADPVQITAGVVGLDSEGGLSYRLMGNGFLAVRDFAQFFWDSTGMDVGCFTEGGCANNELFTFSTRTFDNVALGHGDLVVMGTEYRDVDFSGAWAFTSPGARLPSTPDLFGALAAPFQFTGTLSGARDGHTLFSMSLTGSGRADVFIARTGPGGWQIDEADSVHYVFSQPAAPVPEPASMLLVGTGIAFIARSRARRVPSALK